MYFLQISRERTRGHARKFGTYDMNSSSRRLYFLVSFASLQRAVSSSIDLDDKGDKYVGGAFGEVHHHFGRAFGVPDVRISFKPVHGFILSDEISALVRCSTSARRVSAHSQIAWLARITLAGLFVRPPTKGYKMLRAGVRPTTRRGWPPSRRRENDWVAVEKHELRQVVTRRRPLFTAGSANPGTRWRCTRHRMRKPWKNLTPEEQVSIRFPFAAVTSRKMRRKYPFAYSWIWTLRNTG